jgi:negative regulator of sigma E activity
VNTDFTFEDMERRPVADSEHVVTGEESIGGVACWLLETRPKPEAESQYSTIKAWIAKDMLLALRVDFFKKDQEPVKRYTVLQMENIQEIWTETKVSMEDLETGHKTVLTTTEIKYNSGIKDTAFSVQSLETW